MSEYEKKCIFSRYFYVTGKSLEGLEGVVPVDSSEKLDRGDDFLSILLIYEDNEKDKFYFFEKGNERYMETGNGRALYDL